MRKTMLTVAVCLAAIGLRAASYYPVTVNYDPGYDEGEERIADFPVLVRIPAESPICAAAGPDGTALRFTDETGFIDYAYEIDTWDPSGESLVWVKLPKLQKDFSFRLYCSGEVSTTAKDVWTGYAGVWHLNAAWDSAEKDLYESSHTTAFIDGTFAVTNAPIGLGHGAPPSAPTAVFSSKVWIDQVGPIQLTDQNVFTVSFWYRPTVPFSSWASAYQWHSLLRAGDSANGIWGVTPGGNVRMLRIDNTHASGGNFSYTMPSEEFDPSVWSRYVIVYNGKSLYFYVNGTLRKSSESLSKNPSWGWTGYLGWGGAVGEDGTDANGAVGGDFDECRFYDGAVSAKRVAADYATMTDSKFLTIGSATEDQGIPDGTVAKVGTEYYGSLAAAVAASSEKGAPIVLMASGLSWTLFAEGDSIAVKAGDFGFEVINGRASGFYIEQTTDFTTGVTTYRLLPQLKVTAMRNVAIYKSLETRDLADLLPAQVAGLAADGSMLGMYDVVWDVKDITKYDHAGVTPVPGTVIVGGETLPVTASVRATLSYGDGYHNIAPEAESLDVYAPEKDGYPYIPNISQFENSPWQVTNGLPALAVNDGGWYFENTGGYDNWNARAQNPYVDADFVWEEPKNVWRIEFFGSGSVQEFMAGGETLSPNLMGTNLETRVKLASDYNQCYEFPAPVSISDLKIRFRQDDADLSHVGITEILIWADGGPVDVREASSSAELTNVAFDGHPIDLVSNVTSYLVVNAKTVTEASGEPNVAVTVLPEVDGIICIVTMAEDGSSETYRFSTQKATLMLLR